MFCFDFFLLISRFINAQSLLLLLLLLLLLVRLISLIDVTNM